MAKNKGFDQSVSKQLLEALLPFSELKLIILFGSFSMGLQNKDSDIDIGVASNEMLLPEQKMRMIEAVAQSFRRPVDLVDLQSKREPIFSRVITKGELIFCSDRNLYAEMIKTVVFNSSDFLPLRSRILKERRHAWIKS